MSSHVGFSGSVPHSGIGSIEWTLVPGGKPASASDKT
jgi:hypothetical protein